MALAVILVGGGLVIVVYGVLSAPVSLAPVTIVGLGLALLMLARMAQADQHNKK